LIQNSFDFYYKKTTNHSDSSSSGPTYKGSITTRATTPNPYLGPSFQVGYEYYNPVAIASRSTALSFDLSNPLKLNSRDSVTPSVGFTATSYPKSTNLRKDKNFTFKVSGVHQMTSKFNLLADVSYINNSSNISESYSYNRVTSSLGVGYNF
jgi:hypothetical protein